MLRKLQIEPYNCNTVAFNIFLLAFNDKRTVEVPLSKTKKPSLSSFLLALQGERCAGAGICCVVEGEPPFKCTGFSFHDFADSHVVIPLGLVTPSPTHKQQGNDDVEE